MDIRHKFIKLFKLFLSFSAEGEDKILLEMFMDEGIRTGTYLDIGAAHPIRFSNTFLLYLWGWKGTCVDITNKWKFKFLRHRDKFIYGFVDADTSYLFPHKLSTSSKEIAENRIKQGWDVVIKKDVPKIDAKNFTGYDLLDLDIDGLDFEILKNLLSIYKPKWILIEDKSFKEQYDIYDFLVYSGYERIANTLRNGLYRRK